MSPDTIGEVVRKFEGLDSRRPTVGTSRRALNLLRTASLGAVTLALMTSCLAPESGGDDAGGGNGPSEGEQIVSGHDVTVSVDEQLCRVNALEVESRAAEIVILEAQVGFYSNDDEIGIEGPFTWNIEPGQEDPLLFTLPADYWSEHDTLSMDIECRIHDAAFRTLS